MCNLSQSQLDDIQTPLQPSKLLPCAYGNQCLATHALAHDTVPAVCCRIISASLTNPPSSMTEDAAIRRSRRICQFHPPHADCTRVLCYLYLVQGPQVYVSHCAHGRQPISPLDNPRCLHRGCERFRCTAWCTGKL